MLSTEKCVKTKRLLYPNFQKNFQDSGALEKILLTEVLHQHS